MNKKSYLPLFIIEVYLLFSLVLLKLGPLNFSIRNEPLFWTLILFYHVAFVLGYMFGLRTATPSRDNICAGNDAAISRRFSLLLIVVFYIWIVVTRNNTHASSYIPIDLFRYAIKGILNPASRYYANKGADAVNLFHGNRLVTGSVLLIYFLYYCFPAFMVFYWKKIRKGQKWLSIGLVLLILLQGFAAGINAVIFHIVFAIGGAFLIVISKRNMIDTNRVRDSKNKKKIKRFVVVILTLGILYFIYNIDSRLGGNVISYYVSKSTDISLRPGYRSLIEIPVFEPLIKGLTSVQAYLCQGYYGFSIALSEPFTTTYGIGHSFFLATSIDSMFGTDIVSRMYQEKITNVWSRTINWHSFYSQMANDVSFFGVIAVMFILGIILSKVWNDIQVYDNPIAKLFFVTLLPVFIFMPMNNQMGNIYGTFFSFWVLFILWVITRKYVIRAGSIRI